jgi:hypothetical protein
MLDSLVRVSRRVGWVTDLLAASLRSPASPQSPTATSVKTPTPGECDATAEFACDRLSRDAGRRRGGPWRGLATPRSGVDPLRGWLTTGEEHEAPHRPPAGSPPSGRRACTAQPAAASFGRETNASGTAQDADPDGPGLGKPCLIFPGPRAQFQTESSRHRISRAHPFTSEQFHVLLNSLFKVLCNFPSRYLFAIGLTAVFSLTWSLPRD